jgi:hypothetical protein
MGESKAETTSSSQALPLETDNETEHARVTSFTEKNLDLIVLNSLE